MGGDTSLSARISRSSLLRYLLSSAALVVAVSVCAGMTYLGNDRFASIALFMAVAFSAWYCGVAPAIATAGLALLTAAYGLPLNLHAFRLPTPSDWIGLLGFLIASALVILMGESRRRQNDAL